MLIPLVCVALVTPWLCWFDLREHRLPNILVVPAIASGLVGCGVEWVTSGRMPTAPLVASIAYSGFLLVLNLIGGMGMGDVKLAAALGLASWTPAVGILSPVAAFLAGGLVSAALLIARRSGKRIAFGPFLLGGFWAAVALVVGSQL